MKGKLWMWLGGTVIVAGGGAAYLLNSPKDAVKWRMAPIQRGNLQQRISASGTLSGLIQVTVGSQVSGTISNLYVDYNSQVKQGQPIAQIDTTVYAATVQDAKANVSKAETAVADAQRQLARSKRLFADKLISQAELDAAQVVADRGAGDLSSAKATLQKAQANLSYCTITAPVAGVVVSRSIDVGQTVAASFSTPNLFVIAQDLTKMKVEASIDEADIGQVKEGQKALFTVDSYPETQFHGRVNQVRLEPVIVQNVVNYKVVVQVANDDLKLRPGMTANVTIQTLSREDVLKVPTAALRFNPSAFMPAEDAKTARTPGGANSQKGGGRMGPGGPGAAGPSGAGRGMVPKRDDRVWILGPDGKPKAMIVKVGITDGQATEISGEGLREGMQVLVGVEDTKRPAAAAAPLGGPRMR
ncbi:MAG: efflux RND transporter periplasmic adaptor subunit [Acidobacteriota bacterium]|nr:efflux RND transporter periplasmic adaptor subunit [Acidobacteriota bacterium]